MKKFLSLTLILVSQIVFSQVSLSGNKLLKDGIRYKFSQYDKVFDNPESKAYFKKARANKTAATILSYVGGFSVGLGIGDMIAQGGEKTRQTMFGSSYVIKPDYTASWILIGAGIGVIGIGIPLTFAANKNAKKAILLENSDTVGFQPYFNIQPTGTGMALNYNF